MLIVIAGILSGCDKYEQTLKKIYNTYTIKTYTVNGIDSLALYKDSLGSIFQFYYEDVNQVNELFINGNRNDGHSYPIICKWSLINNNEVIKIITAYAYTGTGPFGNNITPEWKILDLTKNEMKMNTTYNGKEYVVGLEGN